MTPNGSLSLLCSKLLLLWAPSSPFVTSAPSPLTLPSSTQAQAYPRAFVPAALLALSTFPPDLPVAPSFPCFWSVLGDTFSVRSMALSDPQEPANLSSTRHTRQLAVPRESCQARGLLGPRLWPCPFWPWLPGLWPLLYAKHCHAAPLPPCLPLLKILLILWGVQEPLPV